MKKRQLWVRPFGMVETQLCRLRGTSDTFVGRVYWGFIICFLWTKPTIWLLTLSFTKKNRSRASYVSSLSINLLVHGSGVCDGATYWATGVKDRSSTQPRVSLITFSPPWNGGIFGTYRLTGLRIRSYVPTPTSIQILGTQGDMFIIRRTRKHFFKYHLWRH